MKRYLFPIVVLAVSTLALQAENPAPSSDSPKPEKSHGNPAEMAQKRIEMMSQSLGLTSEQSEKLKEVMKAQAPEREKIKEDTSLSPEQKREKMKALREQSDKEISNLLTPEQQTKWTEQKEKMKQAHGKESGKPKANP